MSENIIIEYSGEKYIYLGNGCKATGATNGWKMSNDLLFKCASCEGIIRANPMQMVDALVEI